MEKGATPLKPFASRAMKDRLTFMIGHNPGRIHFFKSIDSTNAYLKARPDLYREPFTVIWADEQTAGRGRKGRSWQAKPGLDVTFTLSVPAWFSPPLYSILAGVSAVKTLRSMGFLEVWIKYPNDLYWGGKKLGGILSESPEAAIVLIGLGINVNSNSVEHASLLQISGAETDREVLLHSLVTDLQLFLEKIQSGAVREELPREVLDAFAEFSPHRRVTVHPLVGNVFEAEIQGLSSVGNIVLQKKDGSVVSVGDECSFDYSLNLV